MGGDWEGGGAREERGGEECAAAEGIFFTGRDFARPSPVSLPSKKLRTSKKRNPPQFFDLMLNEPHLSLTTVATMSVQHDWTGEVTPAVKSVRLLPDRTVQQQQRSQVPPMAG